MRVAEGIAMPGKKISIECGRLRREFLEALNRLLGDKKSFMNVYPEDLKYLKSFDEHCAKCDDCSAFLREKKKASRVALELED